MKVSGEVILRTVINISIGHLSTLSVQSDMGLNAALHLEPITSVSHLHSPLHSESLNLTPVIGQGVEPCSD